MREIQAFLEEALVMADFDHPNVLTMIGIVLDRSGPRVIMPYMQNGDLHEYIKEPDKVPV